MESVVDCLVEATGLDGGGGAVAAAAAFFASPPRRAADKGRAVTLSCSGALLRGGAWSRAQQHAWVLAPASLLLPFAAGTTAPGGPAAAAAEALRARGLAPGTELRVSLRRCGGSGSGVERRTTYPAAFGGVVRCGGAAVQGARLLRDIGGGGGGNGSASPAWRIGWWLQGRGKAQPNGSGGGADGGAALLSTWALLRLPREALADAEAARPAAAGVCACGPEAGQALRVVGSPFGCLAPAHFAGAVVEGCVSNLLLPQVLEGSGGGGAGAGAGAALFAVDAHCQPGMEGAPVACSGCGGLLGMLAPPLSTDAQHCEVPLAVAAAPLLAVAHAAAAAAITGSGAAGAAGAACAAPGAAVPAPPLVLQACAAAERPGLRRCAAGVVLIRAGGSWATGVAATERLIVTNAHVLPPAAANSSSSGGALARECWVRLPGGAWAAAEPVRVYLGPVDLAVLRLAAGPDPSARPRLAPLALAADEPPEGARVLVVGHGLFGPRCGLAPSVTRGSLARAVRLPTGREGGGGGSGDGGSGGGKRVASGDCGGGGMASMLVVTAAVHAGASGGALVDSAGRLVGVVTSNTRHHSGATLPRFAYAVGAGELAPLWELLRRGGSGGDIEARLAALDRRDAATRRLWALQDPGGGGGGGGAASNAASDAVVAPVRHDGSAPFITTLRSRM